MVNIGNEGHQVALPQRSRPGGHNARDTEQGSRRQVFNSDGRLNLPTSRHARSPRVRDSPRGALADGVSVTLWTGFEEVRLRWHIKGFISVSRFGG